MFEFRLFLIILFIWGVAAFVVADQLSPWFGIASVCVGFIALFSALFAQKRA